MTGGVLAFGKLLSRLKKHNGEAEQMGMELKRILSAGLVSMILTVASASSAIAKPKENTYPTSCDRVWAAVKLVTAPPHYNFTQLDDAQKKGIVSTGNALTGKRILDITLSGTGNTCTVAIGGVFSGLVHNDKGDLFERIKEALGETPESTLAPTVGSPQAKATSGTSLTNADVLKLHAAGIGEQLIIDKIDASPTNYRLDTTDIVELKQAGLSDAIIGAMMQASRR